MEGANRRGKRTGKGPGERGGRNEYVEERDGMGNEKEGEKWSSLELSVAREITPFVMCCPRKYEELSSVPSIYQKI